MLAPYTPKEALASTGKGMPYLHPGWPFRSMGASTRMFPAKTVAVPCHHDIPSSTRDPARYHVGTPAAPHPQSRRDPLVRPASQPLPLPSSARHGPSEASIHPSGCKQRMERIGENSRKHEGLDWRRAALTYHKAYPERHNVPGAQDALAGQGGHEVLVHELRVT